MRLTELVQACEAHPPTAIVLAPDDFSSVLEFINRATLGEWRLSDSGTPTYRGVPIVPSRQWQRPYLIVEDCDDGPLIHVFG